MEKYCEMIMKMASERARITKLFERGFLTKDEYLGHMCRLIDICVVDAVVESSSKTINTIE